MKKKLREVGDYEDKFNIMKRYKILRCKYFKRLSVTKNRPQLFIERLIRQSHRGAERGGGKGKKQYLKRLTIAPLNLKRSVLGQSLRSTEVAV